MSAEQKIRAAVQALLDEHGDGWELGQIVIAMGLERVTADGRLESSAWVWAPAEQADWMTTGLLDEAQDLRAYIEHHDD